MASWNYQLNQDRAIIRLWKLDDGNAIWKALSAHPSTNITPDSSIVAYWCIGQYLRFGESTLPLRFATQP
jgi:hypothetical protein